MSFPIRLCQRAKRSDPLGGARVQILVISQRTRGLLARAFSLLRSSMSAFSHFGTDLFSSGSSAGAGKNESGRQIAPDGFAVYGLEITLQQPPDVEVAQSPPPQLQAMKILVLCKHSGFAQNTVDSSQEGMPLAVGHETQSERGNYGINMLVAAAAQFRSDGFGVGIYYDEARIGYRRFQMPAKPGVCLERPQSRVGRNPIQQGPRHYAGARAQFRDESHVGSSEGPEHRLSKIARTGSDGSDGLEVS